MVGQEGAVLVEDEDEAEHGEGGEEEEEEVPEQVGRPEGGRVQSCHDLHLLRARRSLADWGRFHFLFLVTYNHYQIPQGKDEEG